MSFEHFCFRFIQVSLHMVWFSVSAFLWTLFGYGLGKDNSDYDLLFPFAVISQLTLVYWWFL